MQVSEAIKKWSSVLGTEIEVEGVAEISHAMSVIYEERNKREIGELITPGILIHGNCLQALVESLPNSLAAYAGSEILYVVKVRILGIVANTGHTFAPLRFGHIYEVEFDDEYAGLQKLVVNDRLKDVVFKVGRSLKASEVKEFEKYFDSFGNMIELKKYLESGDEVVLVSRILENETTDYIDFLKRINVEFWLNQSPIESGFWGMP
jgi:hypothetical protein